MAVVLITMIAVASWGCGDNINFLKARNQLNKGVKAFEASNFPRAVTYFDEAIELDSELLDALTFRACAYMMQYIPGVESEDNARVASEAISGFQEVLMRDPSNTIAQEYMASLYYNMTEFDKAKQAYTELLASNPDHKIAHYTIGVINWAISYPRDMEVRADLGMQPDDPGPIKNTKAREELAQGNGPLIEEGLQHLEQAVTIDPLYDDAMAYINLLYRQKADIAESTEQYEEYISMANDWSDKVLETRRIKAEASTQEAF